MDLKVESPEGLGSLSSGGHTSNCWMHKKKSSEYWTIVNCTNQLETALRPPDRELVYFLHQNGFISEETCHDVLKPRTMLTDHDKAWQLISGIRTQVNLNSQKYHEFIDFLHNSGKRYESLVTILKNEYLREKDVGAQQQKKEGNRMVSAETSNCFYKMLPIIMLLIGVVCAVPLISIQIPQLHYKGTDIYSTHLKKIYDNHKVFTDGKWPAIPAKSYINLAIVSHTSRDLDEIRQHRLHGNVKEMLKGKESIQLDGIFESTKTVPLILVEGAPGIGKSTLTWELCRRWKNGASFMIHFSLVVLYRLRENSTQQISNVYDLFFHEDKKIQQLVSDEVTADEGKGVLFILDGFDEFLHKANYENFLTKLMTGRVLPDSTVLVTTRPSATATLLNHGLNIDQRIEILGFTQEQVKDFAYDAFSSYEPDILKNFLMYIEASKNPAINSLMYIPLNAAIIAEVYKKNYKIGLPVPKTLTQLYTELCLTMLRRFLAANDPYENIILNKIEDMSYYGTFYDHFQNLSHIAFEEFSKENAIIYTLPRNLVHFGLLDSVQDLYGGGKFSYNFLHLTIQEFLAAYHISCHDSSEKMVFKLYGHDERWKLVWMFVAGISKFNYFVNNTQDEVFVDIERDSIRVKLFFFLCLFEAEVDSGFDLKHIYEGNETFQINEVSTSVNISSTSLGKTLKLPNFVRGTDSVRTFRYKKLSDMDMYVLGYFLVNSASTISWKIQIQAKTFETFVHGLNTRRTGEKSVIQNLEFINAEETYLNQFPERILHGIARLCLKDSNVSALGEAIVNLKNLKSLSIIQSERLHIKAVFHQILKHDVDLEELNLSRICFSELELTYLSKMICPQFGSLKSLHLSTEYCFDVYGVETLLNLLLSPSSLATLSVSCCESEDFYTLLKTNDNLKNLTLHLSDIPSLDSLETALEHNTKLQYLNLVMDDYVAVKNCNNLKLISEFSQRSQLSKLIISIKARYYGKIEKDYFDLATGSHTDILLIKKPLDIYL